MSEEGLGIGAKLRAAREAKGWSPQEAGSRLRLMSRQIEAIEAEDFSRLGQPVFARGFVRNYAKLLGLNPDELLDQMTVVKVPRMQETESLPFTPSQEFWKSPWVLGVAAAVILAVAIPVGLYWWLSSDETGQAAPAVAEKTVQPPPPPPAPMPEGEQPAASGVPLAEQPAGAPDGPQGAAQPAEQTAAPQAAAPAPAVQQAATQPAQAAVKPAPAASAVPAAAPAPAAGLRLQFDEISWVQVRDSSGQIVHSGLNPAGASVDVAGKAPFYLVVGNAEKVRVLYKGKAIDLKPFTSVNVARLTLNP
jgi:cytoskeleton protein RodZ